jgi:hypothetical protein
LNGERNDFAAWFNRISKSCLSEILLAMYYMAMNMAAALKWCITRCTAQGV